jgi:hypothetical protein
VDAQTFSSELGTLIVFMDEGDHRKALKEVSDYIADKHKDRFIDSRDPRGHYWKALSPETRKGPRRRGGRRVARGTAMVGEMSPLVDSGLLMAAASAKGAYTRGAIREIDKSSLLFGIDEGDIPYAIFHQEGTRKMPQREFFGINLTMEREIAKIIERHTEEQIVEQFEKMSRR